MLVSSLRAAATFQQKMSSEVPRMMKTRGMKTQICRTKCSVPVSGSSKIANDVKGVVGCMTESHTNIIKEDVPGSSVQNDAIRNDPGRLSKMTVKELRAIARSLGIPSQGGKKDLISALICYSGKEGSESEERSPDDNVHPTDISPKQKAKDLSTGDDEQNLKTVSNATEKKYKRNRRKQNTVESTSTENRLTTATKKMLSVDESKVLDTIKMSSKRKRSLIIQSNEQIIKVASAQMGHSEPWTILAHKNPQAGWIPYNPKSMRPPHPSRETGFLKLMSWNVNGLRALLKMGSSSVLQMAQREDFDVLCLQETKMKERDVEEIKDLIQGYENSYWTCSVSKLGYSGTAIVSRIKPISVKYGLGIPDHDSEGRLITAEFDKFYLINAYVPNSGDGLKRLDYRIKQWDLSLSRYLKELEQWKPVILTGDLNCAHEEIDIYNPAGNRRSAGFTWEERESFETNFLSKGFIDTFRKQHPDVVAYTFWGYRHGGRKTNKGWRLDYFLVSESLADKVYDSYIVPEVGGSDHCPIGLILNL